MTRSFPDASTALHDVAHKLHGVRRRLNEAIGSRRSRVPPELATTVLEAELDILGIAGGLSELNRPERPIATKEDPLAA